MEDKELSALKALAEAATPGPWAMHLSDNATPYLTHGACADGTIPGLNDLGNRVCVMPSEISTSYNSYANGKFIARANPAAVLSLISRVEQAETASTERANNAIDQTILSMQTNSAASADLSGLTRYESASSGAYMYEVPFGEYVKLSDVQALLATPARDVGGLTDEHINEIWRKHLAHAAFPKELAGIRAVERAVLATFPAPSGQEFFNKLARQQAPVGEPVADYQKLDGLLGSYRTARAEKAKEAKQKVIDHITAWKDAQLARERQESKIIIREGAWDWDARSEAAQKFMEQYIDTNSEKLLGNYEAQPIIRRLAAAILEWQQDVLRHAPDGVCGDAATPAAQAQGEPVAWEFRFYDQDNEPHKWGEWERVEAHWGGTIADRVAEIRAYIARGYKYELRALYAGAAPQADEVRDAARWCFTMEMQELARTGDQPEPIIAMWRKVYAEHRLHPTREEYEAATDACIALRTTAADNQKGGKHEHTN